MAWVTRGLAGVFTGVFMGAFTGAWGWFLIATPLAIAQTSPSQLEASAPAVLEADPALQRQVFFLAVSSNNVRQLRAAMLAGVNANDRDDNGTPALVAAARDKSWEVFEILLQSPGVLLDQADARGSTALMYAALHGEVAMVLQLLERGAELNQEGWTALHFAAANGHRAVMRLLLDQHAYIDAESPNRTTPLMMAARQGHTEAVRMLIEEGADPTIQNQSGFTATEYARRADQKALVAELEAYTAAFARRYRVPPIR